MKTHPKKAIADLKTSDIFNSEDRKKVVAL